MSQASLPADVVAHDHRLEQLRDRTARELMKHRWHWTEDETNPGRVSIRAYAWAVGRDESSIRTDVRAWELLRGSPPQGRTLTVSQAIRAG